MRISKHAKKRWRERELDKVFPNRPMKEVASKALKEGSYYGRHAGCYLYDHERECYEKEVRKYHEVVFVFYTKDPFLVTVFEPR